MPREHLLGSVGRQITSMPENSGEHSVFHRRLERWHRSDPGTMSRCSPSRSPAAPSPHHRMESPRALKPGVAVPNTRTGRYAPPAEITVFVALPSARGLTHFGVASGAGAVPHEVLDHVHVPVADDRLGLRRDRPAHRLVRVATQFVEFTEVPRRDLAPLRTRCTRRCRRGWCPIASRGARTRLVRAPDLQVVRLGRASPSAPSFATQRGSAVVPGVYQRMSLCQLRWRSCPRPGCAASRSTGDADVLLTGALPEQPAQRAAAGVRATQSTSVVLSVRVSRRRGCRRLYRRGHVVPHLVRGCAGRCCGADRSDQGRQRDAAACRGTASCSLPSRLRRRLPDALGGASARTSDVSRHIARTTSRRRAAGGDGSSSSWGLLR